MVYNNSSRQKLLLSFCFFPGSLLIHAHTCFHQSMKVIVRLFFLFYFSISPPPIWKQEEGTGSSSSHTNKTFVFIQYTIQGEGSRFACVLGWHKNLFIFRTLFNYLISYLVLCIEVICFLFDGTTQLIYLVELAANSKTKDAKKLAGNEEKAYKNNPFP